jgi:hypothetical protein
MTVCKITLKPKGKTWSGQARTVTLGSGTAQNPNAGRTVLCKGVRLSLISWNELKRAGWKVDETLSGMWHPRAEVTVRFEAKHGSLYLLLKNDDDDDYNDDEIAEVTPAGFLSNLMRNYITFGAPDMTKLRKDRNIRSDNLSRQNYDVFIRR